MMMVMIVKRPESGEPNSNRHRGGSKSGARHLLTRPQRQQQRHRHHSTPQSPGPKQSPAQTMIARTPDLLKNEHALTGACKMRLARSPGTGTGRTDKARDLNASSTTADPAIP